MIIRPADQVRFWARATRVASGCWEFSGSGNSRAGHRVFYVNNKRVLAHRAAWEMSRGPIPDGLCVCHHCDNPPCVNPEHLFLGTVADNNADRDRKGRGRLPDPEQVRRPVAGPIKHGTITGYVKRECRCDACREAIRQYRARMKLREAGLHLTGHPNALTLPKPQVAALARLRTQETHP